MIVQIVVAAILSLMSCASSDRSTESSSGSDSLDDFCESERLQSLAFERWAEDAPESEVAKAQIAWARWKPKPHVLCDPDSQLSRWIHGPGQGRRPQENWTDSWQRSLNLNRNTAGSALSMLETNLWVAEDFADVEAGLSDRQMSVETLLLFTEARIYAQRAFWGALDEAKLDEAK